MMMIMIMVRRKGMKKRFPPFERLMCVSRNLWARRLGRLMSLNYSEAREDEFDSERMY